MTARDVLLAALRRAGYSPIAARDMVDQATHDAEAEAELEHLREQMRIVEKFVAERAESITAIENCHPNNRHDYWRWQGHAEKQRQLAERLGLPVAWPPGHRGGTQ